MRLVQYVPISIGVFAAVVFVARYFGVPAAPFALVILVGEIIIGLQVENQRILHILGDVVRGFKSVARHH